MERAGDVGGREGTRRGPGKRSERGVVSREESQEAGETDKREVETA